MISIIVLSVGWIVCGFFGCVVYLVANESHFKKFSKDQIVVTFVISFIFGPLILLKSMIYFIYESN